MAWNIFPSFDFRYPASRAVLEGWTLFRDVRDPGKPSPGPVRLASQVHFCALSPLPWPMTTRPGSASKPRNAEEAARAISPLDEEAWLRVAEEWLKPVVSAEDRHRGVGGR